MLCPACHFDNPGHHQFCIHCHATLFLRCPKCWHEQSTRFTCKKCDADMDSLWRSQAGAAEAVLVRQESTNMEESSRRGVAKINGIGAFLWLRSFDNNLAPLVE